MKPTIKTLLLTTTLFSFVFTNCKKKNACDYDFPDNVNASSIQVIFRDSVTHNYLYPERNPLPNYNVDSLVIVNHNNTILTLLNSIYSDPINPLKGYWEVNLGPIYDYRTDNVSFQNSVKRNFYIFYNNTDKDTLSTEFKSVYTQCGSMFEYVKIYYKSKLIDSLYNGTFKKITITKY
jgi:hypothetical protein